MFSRKVGRIVGNLQLNTISVQLSDIQYQRIIGTIIIIIIIMIIMIIIIMIIIKIIIMIMIM